MDISLFMLSISFANLLWIFSCKKEYHYPVCSKAFFNVDLYAQKEPIMREQGRFFNYNRSFSTKKTVLFVVP